MAASVSRARRKPSAQRRLDAQDFDDHGDWLSAFIGGLVIPAIWLRLR